MRPQNWDTVQQRKRVDQTRGVQRIRWRMSTNRGDYYAELI